MSNEKQNNTDVRRAIHRLYGIKANLEAVKQSLKHPSDGALSSQKKEAFEMLVHISSEIKDLILTIHNYKTIPT